MSLEFLIVREFSNNDEDMSKGQRSQFKGASTEEIWGKANLNINSSEE
jgi:hypothetical protein